MAILDISGGILRSRFTFTSMQTYYEDLGNTTSVKCLSKSQIFPIET